MTPNYNVILEKIDINKCKYCLLNFITRHHNLAVVAGSVMVFASDIRAVNAL